MGRPLNKRYFNPPAGVIAGEGVASIAVSAAGQYTAAGAITKPNVALDDPQLPGGVQATASTSTLTMKALTATVATSGSGGTNQDYAPGQILTVSGGTGATSPTFTVSTVEIRTAANVADAGGFSNGDTVTFSTGWAIPAVLTLSVVAGNITGVTYTNRGSRSTALPVDPVQPDATSGGGTLAGTTFNLGFGVRTVTVANAGSRLTLPNNPASTSVNTGTGTGAELNVTYGVLAVPITDAGSGYSTAPSVTFSGGSEVAAATGTSTLTSTNSYRVLLPHARVPGSANTLDADVVKQTSTSSYVMTTDDGTGECGLVPSNSPAQGQAYLLATDSGGGSYWVIKLTAHKAVLRQRGGGPWIYPNGYSAPWSFDAAAQAVVQVENI